MHVEGQVLLANDQFGQDKHSESGADWNEESAPEAAQLGGGAKQFE